MPPQNPPPEIFAFDFDASLAEWNVTPREWMRSHDKHWHGLAVANVVFDDQARVLLVQRAAHDSMPNRWEVPGGAADQEDGDEDNNNNSSSNNKPSKGSVLRAAARELWEESGLVAHRYLRLVPQPNSADAPGFVFTNRTGKRVFCRFAFEVQVRTGTPVVLDPEEHQDYVWATKKEVEDQKLANGREIPLTVLPTQAMILEAFRLRGT